MDSVVKLNKWANAHTNIALDALRVLYGLFILYKGVFFLQDTEYLSELLTQTGPEGTYFVLVHYVALTHLCGGFFIAIGLLTRISALFQIPIFIGAVLINFAGPMIPVNLLQASLALVLSVFFVFYGSGKHSADYSLQLNM